MQKQKATHLESLGANQLFIFIGIILVAFTLRSPITSVGPLTQMIRNDTGISNSLAGLLTTLPLLGFAIFSFYAPKLGHRFGNQWMIFIGTLLLLIGILIRSAGSVLLLFAGTAVIGVGVAISNVLVPSLVKELYPKRIGFVTGIYTASLNLFAALGSGLSIPLAEQLHLGWRNSLLFWIIFVVLATIVWVPQLFHPSVKNKQFVTAKTPKKHKIWKSSLAWKVTLYMGFQSFLYFCIVSWLPEILYANGISYTSSGWLLLALQIASLPPSFLVPILAQRLPHHHRIIVIVTAILSITGFVGLLVSQGFLFIAFSVILIGVSQGSSLSFSLVMLGIKVSNSTEAAQLSGMSQGVGYALAAVGPLLVGILLDATGSPKLSIYLFIITAFLILIVGLGASKNKKIFDN